MPQETTLISDFCGKILEATKVKVAKHARRSAATALGGSDERIHARDVAFCDVCSTPRLVLAFGKHFYIVLRVAFLPKPFWWVGVQPAPSTWPHPSLPDRLTSGYAGGKITPACPSFAGYRFPAEVISQAVWLYLRFPLNLRMVEEMLAFRGLVVSHETLRQ